MARRWTEDDDLNAGQLAAMDALWQARRDGIDAAAGDDVEALVREDRVVAARRRLAAARRAIEHHASTSPPTERA